MSRRRDNADRFADAIAPFERPAGQHHMSPLVGPDRYLGVRQKLAAKINLTYCGQRTLRREPFGGWVWLLRRDDWGVVARISSGLRFRSDSAARPQLGHSCQ